MYIQCDLFNISYEIYIWHRTAPVKKLGEWTFGGGVEHAYFLGDAPEFGKQPFGESKVTIHYKKGTKGWDNTGLEEWYTLIEE